MSESARPVIVGGGIIGSCVALFLARSGVRDVVVVERDLSYRTASTPRSAAALRQQFHLGVNVAMSHFGYEFFSNLAEYLPEGHDPDIGFVDRGYLVLAAREAMDRLSVAHRHQIENGAHVDLLDNDELRARFPWLKTDDLGGATFGTAGEGWFDPVKALEAVRTAATHAGATYVEDELVDIEVERGHVTSAALASGSAIATSVIVDAAGAGAARVAAMVGGSIPVEGRKRTVFLFRPETHVEDLPCLADPTVAGRGMFVRSYDDIFMAVTAPPPERDPDTEDLEPDEYLFDEVIRPALARRVRGFEKIDLVRTWAGHYELNTFDQNAIIGEHPDVRGFYLACGLSGHGVMHAPAVGRGVAQLVTNGTYETIDLSPFTLERIRRGHRLDDIQLSEVRRERAGI